MRREESFFKKKSPRPLTNLCLFRCSRASKRVLEQEGAGSMIGMFDCCGKRHDGHAQQQVCVLADLEILQRASCPPALPLMIIAHTRRQSVRGNILLLSQEQEYVAVVALRRSLCPPCQSADCLGARAPPPQIAEVSASLHAAGHGPQMWRGYRFCVGWHRGAGCQGVRCTCRVFLFF